MMVPPPLLRFARYRSVKYEDLLVFRHPPELDYRYAQEIKTLATVNE